MTIMVAIECRMARRKTAAQLDRDIARVLQQDPALTRAAMLGTRRRAGVEDRSDPEDVRRFRQLAVLRKAERATERKARQEAAIQEYAFHKDRRRFEKRQKERGIANPIGARFPLREGTGSQRPVRR